MDEDDRERDERVERPILVGVGALVAVALVVGLILGGVALVASRVLGVGGDESASAADRTGGETLYLPPPEKTEATDGAGLSTEPDTAGPSTIPPISPSEAPDGAITLEVAQTAVGAMEQIDLSGTYPDGAGAILQVQQFEDGGWGDFPVTISVGGDDFSTFIQASAVGLNRFRVVDTDSDETSNEISVQIS